ncbi:MAG: tryptophan-rich sensory protein [Clostridia bacterium]|nr:tryptophan-rich sensory protein [Clostridia bacterium]
MDKNKLKTYGISILIAESVGIISGLISASGMQAYDAVNKPALTPPDIVFPIVWTILYALMGISAARIWLAPPTKERNHGLIIYALQLFVNFFWSIIFFNLQAFGVAFIWLVLLWILIVLMIITFNKTDRLAALLQIPYLIWVTFAGYLNFMVWMLNK